MASWGDVVISSCIAKAIKEQKPDWKVTYYTSTTYGNALHNNPDIDELIEKKTQGKDDAFAQWGHVRTDVEKDNKFDKVIIPWAGVLPRGDWKLKEDHKGPNNFMWSCPRAIQELGLTFKGSIQTYLYQTKEEVDKAREFVTKLNKDSHKLIMMETAGFSCQTHWKPNWTRKAVELLIKRYGRLHLFISGGGEVPDDIKNLQKKHNSDAVKIHYMSNFTLREMSALFNHCDIMFSVSSGTANACMTHMCRKNIKWFELVNDSCWDSVPMGNIKNKLIYRKNNMDEYFRLVNSRL
jgi:ADP-heptose:LPS heptosyltransferase